MVPIYHVVDADTPLVVIDAVNECFVMFDISLTKDFVGDLGRVDGDFGVLQGGGVVRHGSSVVFQRGDVGLLAQSAIGDAEAYQGN